MRTLAIIAAGCAVSAFTWAGVDPAVNLANWHGSFDSDVHAGMHGELTTTETADQTTATLKLTGAPPDASFPWHIHEGSCGSGEIVGGESAYSPVTAAADSTASATATLSVLLDEAKQYHVDVHASSSEMGTIIGCGDLTH